MRQSSLKSKQVDIRNYNYGKEVVYKLCKTIGSTYGSNENKGSIYFYFQNVEDLVDTAEIEKVLHFLKISKIIKTYLITTGSKLVNSAFENDPKETLFYIKCVCTFIDEKVIKYAQNLSILPKYTIRLGTKSENSALILNDKYILSTPRYANQPLDLLEVVINYSRTQLKRAFIEQDISRNQKIKYAFSRRLAGMIHDLGFTKELRKVFFPHLTQEGLYFRNHVYLSELENEKINFKQLDNGIADLKLCRSSKK